MEGGEKEWGDEEKEEKEVIHEGEDEAPTSCSWSSTSARGARRRCGSPTNMVWVEVCSSPLLPTCRSWARCQVESGGVRSLVQSGEIR